MTDVNFSQYPSVEMAYERIGDWYELPQRRLDVIEGRVGALIGLTVTLALGVLALSGDQVDAAAWQLVAAMAVGLLVVAAGLWRLHSGTLLVLNPAKLYDEYLHLEPIEAKYRLFYWASEHYAHNMSLVKSKARWLDALTVGFVAEAILLSWWILG